MYRVLQLDSERGWRGGQRQTQILIDGLDRSKFQCYLLADKESGLPQRVTASCHIELRSLKGLNQVSAASFLKQFCEKEKIDLIDCQSSGAHTIAFLAHKIFGLRTPIVVHRRVDFPLSQSWFQRNKYFSPSVKRYVAISKAIADVLVQSGVSPSLIDVVKSAVEWKTVTPKQKEEARRQLLLEHGRDDSSLLIVNTAALTDQKDHKTFIDALKILKRKGTKFLTIICGEGKNRPALEAQVKQLGLEEDVLFKGHVDNVNYYLTAADVFVLTSVLEGLGTSLLDAGLHRCPIVATRTGGIPEIVEHMKTGLLSPVGDSGSIAANIQLLHSSKEHRLDFVDSLLQKIRHEYVAETMVAQNEEVYLKLLEVKS